MNWSNQNFAHRRMAGITLIELLVVMTIIGIIAAVGIPSYRVYVVRTHRAAAKACMSEYAQFMERYYTTHMSYVDANPTLGCASESGLNNQYTINAIDTADPTQSTYTITATPINSQADQDAGCGTLTLDQAGTRTRSGTASFDKCW